MAEVLGLIASGINIAQIAGEIIAAGLKIKKLLDEVDEAPETLTTLLEQIDTLAPILCCISIDETTTPVSAQLRRAFQNAVSACDQVANRMEFLARDLAAKIESSRGMRRRMNMTKVALKKSLLHRHETHLHAAIQYLSLAQQTYILYDYLNPDLTSIQI